MVLSVKRHLTEVGERRAALLHDAPRPASAHADPAPQVRSPLARRSVRVRRRGVGALPRLHRRACPLDEVGESPGSATSPVRRRSSCATSSRLSRWRARRLQTSPRTSGSTWWVGPDRRPPAVNKPVDKVGTSGDKGGGPGDGPVELEECERTFGESLVALGFWDIELSYALPQGGAGWLGDEGPSGRNRFAGEGRRRRVMWRLGPESRGASIGSVTSTGQRGGRSHRP